MDGRTALGRRAGRGPGGDHRGRRGRARGRRRIRPRRSGRGPAGRGRRDADGEPSAWRCEADADGVTVEAVGRYDATRSLAHVAFSGARGRRLDVDARRARRRVVSGSGADRGRVDRRGSDVPGRERAYAKERFTFGRAIGSYQAIKHELTEVLRRLENARGLQYYAGWARESRPDEFPLAASAARSAAGEALDFAARSMINVHGGIGATWEHDAPLFFRRAELSRRLLGGTHDATDGGRADDAVVNRTVPSECHDGRPTSTDPAREVLNQAPRLQPIDLFSSDLALRRRSSARAAAGASTAPRRRAASPAAPRRSSTAAVPSATCRSAHPRSLRQPDRRGRARPSWHWLLRGRGRARRSTACRGVSPSPEPTWSGRRCSRCGATPTTASCARCR